MKPRFPLSHRACHHRDEETTRERTRTTKEGGLTTAIIDPPDLIGPALVTNRRPTPQFLIVATPQF